MRKARAIAPFAFVFCAVSVIGYRGTESPTRPVHGTVIYRGEPVPIGHIRFVPIDGTPGPASFASITDGQYRIDKRGGVPIGRHRVEVEARRKTGRKVTGDVGTEMGIVDETEQLGPAEYSGPNSPLIVDVSSDGDGKIDIELK
jgi:hypothetical protein